MSAVKIKAKRLNRRKMNIRHRIFGTSERLRMTVSKSSSHIYVQIINDTDGVTLASASTLDKEIKTMITPEMSKMDLSKLVGKVIAERAVKNNIKKIAFDRNGNIYHGRVKALADSAREAGLEF
ncbi:MAG: 50S ribosomal protein L18 [Candidatus Kapabacteria bacterium]|nr:50S ribosomal protein L18 [Candidatus Kapabacteria bacterium]